MARIELTHGAWAELRDDADRVTNGERRRALAAMESEASDVLKSFVLSDALLALIITAWSFDLPLPRDDRASLDAIPGVDYDRLLFAAKSAQDAMFADFSPSPDTASPTQPASV